MLKYLERIIAFASRMLYYTHKYKLSFDKAFQYIAKEMRNELKGYGLRRFYEISWNIVSNYYKLRHIEEVVYGANKGYKRLVMLWLVFYGEKYLQEIKGYSRVKKKFLKSLPVKSLDAINILAVSKDDIRRLSIEKSYPYWFVKILADNLGLSETEKLLDVMNKEFYWIRINTLKIDYDKALKLLEAEGVTFKVDKDLWYMLEVLEYKKPLYQLELLKQGFIITQDKASAMVVEALDPQPDEKILDACAAPGIKASLVMQLTENKADLILVDISRNRVNNMVKLLKLYGVDLSRVEIILADSIHRTIHGRVDKALLDAPCSSSGTIPRDPAVKLHLDDISWVKRFPRLQYSLLNTIVEEAYETIYATCSLIPWEGEEVIERLLQNRSDIRLQEPINKGLHGYSKYKVSRKVRRFFPHIHKTEGFFVSKIISQLQCQQATQ